jgi:hypothetical protein
MDTYQLKDWVLVNYDGEQYPGIVTDSTSADYEVKVMRRSGKNWAWPPHEDCIFYSEKNVVRKICAPTTRGSRGQLSFPFI